MKKIILLLCLGLSSCEDSSKIKCHCINGYVQTTYITTNNMLIPITTYICLETECDSIKVSSTHQQPH